jgi:hypothetical protein
MNAGTNSSRPAHEPRFLITLLSSSGPLDQVARRLPALGNADVFCEHCTSEDGDRYRLQLGYFKTREAATRVLQTVRRVFPRAMLRLDDSSASCAHTRADAAGTAASGSSPRAHWPGLSTPVRHLPSAGTSSHAAARAGVACYAVDLVWAQAPVDLRRVPPLTLFDGHVVYAVSAERGGQRSYGLRLGFFADREAAVRVASEIGSYFSAATAVPVGRDEVERGKRAEIGPWAVRVGSVAVDWQCAPAAAGA